MSAHFEAVEADFQSHYGLDLRRALWGAEPLGVRRLLSLIRGLPPRGAVARTATNGRDWGTTEELLAAVVELTDLTNRLVYQAFSGKGAKKWKPVVVSRPTDPPKKPAAGDELRAFFTTKAEFGSAKYTGGEA